MMRSTTWYPSDGEAEERTLCFGQGEETSYTGNGFPFSSFASGLELSHVFVFDYLSYPFFDEQYFSGLYRS